MIAKAAAVRDGLKRAVGTARQIDKLELQQKLLDKQETIQRLSDELHAAKERNKELERKISQKESFEYQNNAYWKGDGRTENDGPFCAPCLDANGLAIRMARINKTHAKCGKCGVIVRAFDRDDDDGPPPNPRPRSGWVRGY